MATESLSLYWYKVSDPATNCKLFIQELADGRWAIQFNDDAPIIKTTDEIETEYPMPPWMYGESRVKWEKCRPFEMLRKHINATQPRAD